MCVSMRNLCILCPLLRGGEGRARCGAPNEGHSASPIPVCSLTHTSRTHTLLKRFLVRPLRFKALSTTFGRTLFCLLRSSESRKSSHLEHSMKTRVPSFCGCDKITRSRELNCVKLGRLWYYGHTLGRTECGRTIYNGPALACRQAR